MSNRGKMIKRIAIPLCIVGIIILINCLGYKIYNKNNYILLSEQEIQVLSNNSIKSIESIAVIDSVNLLVMNYYGDYSFKEYLEKGSDNDQELYNFLNSQNFYPNERMLNDDSDIFGCTCISNINNKKDVLFGRNFDWLDQPSMLLYTDPEDGYASISMVNAYYLGYDFHNIKGDYELNGSLLSAPYFPLDGMNECGLAIGVMSLPHSEPRNDEGKKTIGSLAAIRLVLDYASNVDEAIELIEQYNIYFNMDVPIHLLISDKSGDSAVVEFLNEKIEITRSSNKWQVSTNFILKGFEKEGPGYDRYEIAENYLSLNSGDVTNTEIMKILHDVSQKSQNGSFGTLWSIVYNLSTLEYDVCTYRNYDTVESFKFGELK